MATLHSSGAVGTKGSDNDEPKSDVVELERTATVQALPDSVRKEAGLLLDTEGLAGQSSLKLAPDGHVWQYFWSQTIHGYTDKI